MWVSVSPVCVGDPHKAIRPFRVRCFPLEIQCRKVSNAERLNRKASRATIGAAYLVGQVGTWKPAFGWILVCGAFRDVSVSCR